MASRAEFARFACDALVGSNLLVAFAVNRGALGIVGGSISSTWTQSSRRARCTRPACDALVLLADDCIALSIRFRGIVASAGVGRAHLASDAIVSLHSFVCFANGRRTLGVAFAGIVSPGADCARKTINALLLFDEFVNIASQYIASGVQSVRGIPGAVRFARLASNAFSPLNFEVHATVDEFTFGIGSRGVVTTLRHFLALFAFDALVALDFVVLGAVDGLALTIESRRIRST